VTIIIITHAQKLVTRLTKKELRLVPRVAI